ncbi:hypothetical protein [Streptomyces sp. DH10]|uniref:hypothetical protein n=1 Tax=Streptomyces sp. DH10 TaxID=3040121 RepID=UPI0024435498|nr:hypothetical protein [Streptomyces sp. DH10]MDG9709651.1 hypothetical protein [Streptomyces sp. DH10]
MLESIALHEPLEAKNEFFAWLVAETFLSTNGVALDYEPEEALALVMRAKHGAPASRRSPRSCAPGPPAETPARTPSIRLRRRAPRR